MDDTSMKSPTPAPSGGGAAAPSSTSRCDGSFSIKRGRLTAFDADGPSSLWKRTRTPGGTAAEQKQSPFPTSLAHSLTGMSPHLTTANPAEVDATAPGSVRPMHVVQHSGPGISPFAVFAEALTPLPEHGSGGTLLSRFSLSGRMPPSAQIGSPRIDAPPSVGPGVSASAAGASSSAGASTSTSSVPQSSSGVVTTSSSKPAASPGPRRSPARSPFCQPLAEAGPLRPGAVENLGTNQQEGGDDGADDRRASTSSATGPTMETGASGSGQKQPASGKRAPPTGSSIAPASSKSTADSKRRSVGGGSGKRGLQEASTPSSTHASLQPIADLIEGGDLTQFELDHMIAGMTEDADGFGALGAHMQSTHPAAPLPLPDPTREAASLQGLFDETALPIKPVKPSKSRGGLKKKCNCRNSKCLKLYCDCFSESILCDGCNCQDCKNNDLNQDDIQTARQLVLKRNPKAFSAKFVAGADAVATKDGKKHARGCNCLKSRCVRNYCECWQAGITCNVKCKCVNCSNGKPHDDTAPPDSADETINEALSLMADESLPSLPISIAGLPGSSDEAELSISSLIYEGISLSAQPSPTEPRPPTLQLEAGVPQSATAQPMPNVQSATKSTSAHLASMQGATPSPAAAGGSSSQTAPTWPISSTGPVKPSPLSLQPGVTGDEFSLPLLASESPPLKLDLSNTVSPTSALPALLTQKPDYKAIVAASSPIFKPKTEAACDEAGPSAGKPFGGALAKSFEGGADRAALPPMAVDASASGSTGRSGDF